MSEVPTHPTPEAGEAVDKAESGGSRWPRVIGTLGIIAGLLMLIDKLDDLLMLPLLSSHDWWARLLGDELAARVFQWIPSTVWIVSAGLIGMALGALLMVGAYRLRHERRSGVRLCQVWAWLALAWLVAEMSRALWWFAEHIEELDELVPGDAWQGPAVFGTLLALIVLAAFPVFLLSWFSRPGIKAQFAGWLE